MKPYYTLKMKRKDLEDVNDEFSDFSLSSPARKIRRLVKLEILLFLTASVWNSVEKSDYYDGFVIFF